ncbi:hypothetical protein EGJ54_22680 [Pandoraea apista]|nr:hypothetical protein AT395_09465 [Pandoraea apista]RRW90335.1 hypothetical protein EGJ54_22680 [Pandoraea apista]RRX00096.1 hypothetical protein EGJ56_20815 [Pandoraea apista]
MSTVRLVAAANACASWLSDSASEGLAQMDRSTELDALRQSNEGCAACAETESKFIDMSNAAAHRIATWHLELKIFIG